MVRGVAQQREDGEARGWRIRPRELEQHHGGDGLQPGAVLVADGGGVDVRDHADDRARNRRDHRRSGRRRQMARRNEDCAVQSDVRACGWMRREMFPRCAARGLTGEQQRPADGGRDDGDGERVGCEQLQHGGEAVHELAAEQPQRQRRRHAEGRRDAQRDVDDAAECDRLRDDEGGAARRGDELGGTSAVRPVARRRRQRDGGHQRREVAQRGGGGEETGGAALDTIRLRTFSSEFYGTSVTLIAPYFHAQRGAKKELQTQRDALDRIIDTYRTVTSREPRRGEPDGEMLTVAHGAGWLISNSLARPAVNPQEGEYLLIARDSDTARAAAIVDDLHLHATETRITVARTTADQRIVHLFHVLDDHKRHSAFQAARAGERFADCVLLAAFADSGVTVFLPENSQPGRASLHYFCRLLRAAPGLFSRHGLAVERGLLAAIAGQAVADRVVERAHHYDFYYLGGLAFFSQIELAPRIPEHIDIEVHDLATSESDVQKLLAYLPRLANDALFLSHTE